jgi:hypothetical protein
MRRFYAGRASRRQPRTIGVDAALPLSLKRGVFRRHHHARARGHPSLKPVSSGKLIIGYALILRLFPDAMQRGALRRRSGIAVHVASEFRKIPGLRRITTCCAAPGIRLEVSRD